LLFKIAFACEWATLLLTATFKVMKTTDHRLKNLKAIPRSDDTTAPLAAEILGVRVSTDIDAVVRSLPNRSAWLRRVITEAAQRELIKVIPELSRRDGEAAKE
jgi:hypothetical protein